jgi:YHS domain-containing protein
MMTKVGLDGYCPVCVVEMKKWEKGNPSIASNYDGMTYYFPSSAIKAKFDASPEKYVPVLNGDCIVCLGNMNKRVPGSVRFSALHQNRLYLFPAEQQKSMFLANPAAFEKTDIASDGNCVVCLAKMSQQVPGSMEHTVIHGGKRYLFPSEKEADMFRQSPQQFVSATSSAGGSGSR